MPELSFLMSCYNAQDWLTASIQSVLSQSFTNFDFIIVNDGSTDNTLKILNYWAEQDNRLKIHNKKNTGLADSLNIGMHLSASKWILRIDSDDMAESKRAEIQYKLAVNGGFQLIGSDAFLMDESGSILGRTKYPTTDTQLKFNLANGYKFFPHSSAMFERELAINLGGYNTNIKKAEDLDLWLKFSEEYKITSVNIPLVRIRQHLKQISNENNGSAQIYDDYAARICFYIRKFGEVDPAMDLRNYQKFHLWIIHRLNEIGIISQNESLRNYKSLELNIQKIKFLIKSSEIKNLAKILHRKYFGNLYLRLAKEWIENERKYKSMQKPYQQK